MEFFLEMYKNGHNANTGSRDFTTWIKSSDKMLTSEEKNRASHCLWFQVQHYPFWTMDLLVIYL